MHLAKNKILNLMLPVFILLFLLPNNIFAQQQYKKLVAVSRFENNSNQAGLANLGTGMADQLADALIQSGKFVVIERQTLEDVVTEQDLAASGRAAQSKTAQTGKLVPAQILIKGAVTEFESETSGSSTGITFSGVSLGAKKTTAHVAVVVRIIDTTTGQVLDSVRVEGLAKASGTKIGLGIKGVDLGTEGFKKTPLGKATQIAIDKAVLKIAEKLDKIPFEGKIIDIKDKMIYTNMGQRNGVVPNSVFYAYAPGEEITDPDTGERLGSDKMKVGSIKITTVEEKFSKAIYDTGGPFEKGYILMVH